MRIVKSKHCRTEWRTSSVSSLFYLWLHWGGIILAAIRCAQDIAAKKDDSKSSKNEGAKDSGCMSLGDQLESSEEK